MRLKTTLFSLLVILLMIALTGCSSKDTETEEPLLTVNGEQLTLEQLSSLYGKDIDFDSDLRQSKTDDWIKLTVLAQEAERLGISDYPELKHRIRFAEKRLLANTLIAMLIEDLSVSETELFNFYQIHKSRYIEEREEYRLQRILLTSAAMADSVSNLIQNDVTTFAGAARSFSQERHRETDGFVGYFTPSEMEPEVWATLQNLSQWRYGRIAVSNGIYLIRYTDKRERTVEKPFTEVREQVREEFLQEQKNDLINREIDNLINRAEIIITR